MIIYCAKNKTNNKIYIGQTKNSLKNRKSQHLRKAHEGKTKFQRAILKYGEINFCWSILDTATTLEELNILEEYYIDFFGSFFKELGYNSIMGGNNHLPSDEVKEKMAKAKRGKHPSKESIQKRVESRKGYTHTEETRQKIKEGQRKSKDKKSKSIKKSWENEDIKNKRAEGISKAFAKNRDLGIKYMWIYKDEKQGRYEMSKALLMLKEGWTKGRIRGCPNKGCISTTKGYKWTEEQLEKKRKASRGRKLSEEQVTKLHEANMEWHKKHPSIGEKNIFYGKKHSESAKEKMRIKKAWINKEGEEKLVKLEELDKYLLEGWNRGRCYYT